MSTRKFGPGYLADKLYDAEAPVADGAFERLTQKRKRRPAAWLSLPAALLVLGVGLGLYLRTATSHVASCTVSTVQQPMTSEASAPGGIEAKTVSDPELSKDRHFETGGRPMPRHEMANTPSPSYPLTTSLDMARLGAAGRENRKTHASTSKAPIATLSGLSQRRRNSNRAIARLSSTGSGDTSYAGSGFSIQCVEVTVPLTHTVGNRMGKRDATLPDRENRMPQPSPLTFDFDTTGIVRALPVLPGSPAFASTYQSVVPVREQPGSSLGLTEVLAGLGPMAIIQHVRPEPQPATSLAEAKTRFAAVNIQPAIGLEGGIQARTHLTRWMALLAGVRTMVFWQSATGTLQPSAQAPASYALQPDGSIKILPQPDQGFTVNSTVWVPAMPQLLLELRLPAANWGLAGGVSVMAYPQTYASYRGAPPAAQAFKITSLAQPVVQIWAQASRTRIDLSARRMQGLNLLPYPAATRSDALLISASMSYRFGW